MNELFGGRGDRRLLETAERKRCRSMPKRYYSETRFKAPGHMMPKMVESRAIRFNSVSNVRMQRKLNKTESEKVYRKI